MPGPALRYGFISQWLLSVNSTLSYVNCTTGQSGPIAASSITEADRGRRVQRRPSMPLVVLSGAERRLWSRIPALRRHAARPEQHRGHVESARLLAVNEDAQRTRATWPARRPLHSIDADVAELKRYLMYESVTRRVLALGARRDACHELAVSALGAIGTERFDPCLPSGW